MTAQTDATATARVSAPAADTARLYQEGLVAGIIGALTVALWFLVVDVLHGRPLYTPTVLGTALFGRATVVGSYDTLPVSMDMVLMFTWVHGLTFAAKASFPPLYDWSGFCVVRLPEKTYPVA